MRIGLTTLVVREYDEAIRFYVDAVGFDLVSDDDMGGGKRWVVVAPPGGRGGGLLLAQPADAAQADVIGAQAGGRVGHFLFTDDFHGQYERMATAGVHFLESPRDETYGWVVVWQDLYGNRWDLLEDRS